MNAQAGAADGPGAGAPGLYRTVRTIRRFEETVEELTAANEIPGTVHLYIGEEAVAAGVCAALERDDFVTSTHRGHGHVIAKGAALGPMLAELMGRANGLNRGRGGSMHVADLSLGVLGANGIVAGGIPFALGATWAAAQDGQTRVAATFFGDGGLAQGLLHECMNWAALWQLPVIFVCEDNGYAVSLPASASAAGSPVARAQSYGIAAQDVDGMDAEEVHAAARAAAQRARAGGGPSYLHMKTYRFRGHHLGEAVLKLDYRTDEEITRWQQRDPMEILAGRIEAGVRAAIDADVEATLTDAIEYARNGPLPGPDTATDYAYASGLRPRKGNLWRGCATSKRSPGGCATR
jgi:TPP-dependent pyruvate/acetoin dehydrogenase alpha subunit